MGLCKCPKRQVTNQFCFEHRVNVCEHCMVQSHPKCIVQSYLQWLRDSDYVSNCTLCGTTLDNSECVRLVCYHVFHWNCLNMRQASLSTNTTARDHICPSCDTEIFPTSNLVSPVADVLKTYLSKVNWGRNGLGLALVLEDSVVSSSASPGFANLKLKSNTNVAYPPKEPDIKHSVLLMDAFNPPSTGDVYASSRRSLLPRQSNIVSSDCDESKYKRRTPAEMFSRWSRRFYTPSTRPLRRRHLIILVGILSFLAIVYIMTILEHGSSNGITANEWINPNPVPNMHYE